MLKYRLMTAEDVFLVAEIERKCFSDAWTAAMFVSILRDDNQLFYVIEDEGKIIGYAGMQLVLDEAQILNVAVEEEYRHKGIGRRIMKLLISRGCSLGMVRFTLEVRESNLPAIGLYKKMGFFEVGRRPNYYTKPSEAALLMDYDCEPEEPDYYADNIETDIFDNVADSGNLEDF